MALYKGPRKGLWLWTTYHVRVPHNAGTFWDSLSEVCSAISSSCTVKYMHTTCHASRKQKPQALIEPNGKPFMIPGGQFHDAILPENALVHEALGREKPGMVSFISLPTGMYIP